MVNGIRISLCFVSLALLKYPWICSRNDSLREIRFGILVEIIEALLVTIRPPATLLTDSYSLAGILSGSLSFSVDGSTELSS